MSENILTDLTIADVQVAAQIIEVCAKRGAFLPQEFSAVGALAQKLNAILEAAKPAPIESTVNPDVEHLHALGKHDQANLLEEQDATYKATRDGYIEAEQFELNLGV